MRAYPFLVPPLLAFSLSAGAARADGPGATRPHAYAVLVGNNAGGPGQTPLRFAEDDAHRVADVLRELGHYDAGDIRLLLHPDAAHVLSSLDDVAAQVRADAAKGEQAEV